MEINQFTANFADQFDDTDANLFTPTTKYKSLEEWSSLTALSIIAMVDDEYEVILKGNDIYNSNTIQELFDIVKSKA